MNQKGRRREGFVSARKPQICLGFIEVFFFFFFFQIKKERKHSAASHAQLRCVIDLHSTVRKTKCFDMKYLFSSTMHFFSHLGKKK